MTTENTSSLTAEQVTFLGHSCLILIRNEGHAAWLIRANMHVQTVWSLAQLIMHMKDEVRDNGIVLQLRAQIEEVVGPLPLSITVAELFRLHHIVTIENHDPTRRYSTAT